LISDDYHKDASLYWSTFKQINSIQIWNVVCLEFGPYRSKHKNNWLYWDLTALLPH